MTEREQAEKLSADLIRLFTTPPAGVHSRDGVSWRDAPLPRRWHRCWPQTWGEVQGEQVERCACGAARLDGFGPWINRNERRRG